MASFIFELQTNGYIPVLAHPERYGFYYKDFEKYRELKDEMKTCKKIMKTIKNLYAKETTIPKEKMSQYMKRDMYLDYDECLKYEIVHGHS